MELIKSQSKKKLLVSVIKILFDVAFVLAIFASVYFLQQIYIAIALVLLSKWRMFFVRVRFWWKNLLSNMPDIVFGISIVVLLYLTGELWLQIIFAVIYLLWIIFIKPKSKRVYIILQAGLVQFFGVWAVFAMAHMIWLPIVLLINFVIGFIVARHIFMEYEEENSRLDLSMIWGVTLAMMAFPAFHWTHVYSFFDAISIPQIAILDILLGLMVWELYDSFAKNNGKIVWNNVKWLVMFAVLLFVVISVVFSGLL